MVFLGQCDLILYKSAVNERLFCFHCGGRIVVIILMTYSRSKKQVVIFQFFIPKVLPERDFLLREVQSRSVNRILVVRCHRKRERHIFLNRKLVFTQKFKSGGVDAFTVNFISATVVLVPLHFAAPAVFVKKSSGKGKFLFAFADEVPLIKNRNTILKRHIGKIIVIVVDGII